MQMFGRWTAVAVLVSCSGLLLSADDEKKSVKLPDAVKSAWNARFQQAEIVQVKSKNEGFEIKAKDDLNEDFKVTYSADGRIVQEKKHKVSTEKLPAQVLQTARNWAQGAKWNDTSVVETKKGEETVYELTGELHGENVKTKIQADGRQVDSNDLPTLQQEQAPQYERPKDWDKPGPKVDHVNRVIRCC
jgi:hypothetical protein